MEKIGSYSFRQGGSDEITSDTLLLADFIPPLIASDSVIDIGAGCGALSLLLAAGNAEVKITAIEVLPGRAEVMRSNIKVNSLSRRLSVFNVDYRTISKKFPNGAFTHVVTNPPYMKKGTGRASPIFEREAARSEVFGGLRDLISVSAHLAGSGGGLYIIFPALRFTELLGELQSRGLRPVRVKFIHPRKEAPACRVLVEARHGPWDESEIVEGPVYLR
ncbi:MAG: tRNA1(Val) (adenine(37)-N6)-methyltransferase [Thermodesulfobacteriota bacterium]